MNVTCIYVLAVYSLLSFIYVYYIHVCLYIHNIISSYLYGCTFYMCLIGMIQIGFYVLEFVVL